MDKKYASVQENLEALANIFSNLLDIISMVVAGEALVLCVVLLFLRKWKPAGISILVGIILAVFSCFMDDISPLIRGFAQISSDGEGYTKAIPLCIGVVLLLVALLGSLLLPVVIGKIRKKKLFPIIGLFLLNFLIPVLYPFALWLALKDEKPASQADHDATSSESESEPKNKHL